MNNIREFFISKFSFFGGKIFSIFEKVCFRNGIWAVSSKKKPSNVHKMCRLKSSCAKYHPGLCSPFIHFVVSNDSVSGQ